MYFCELDKRQSKEIALGIKIKTFWSEKMLVSIVDLDAKTFLPLHSHEHEQCGIVISGEMILTIAGESKLLKSGDSYIIPGNVEHQAEVGNQPARVYDVFAPVREEYKY